MLGFPDLKYSAKTRVKETSVLNNGKKIYPQHTEGNHTPLYTTKLLSHIKIFLQWKFIAINTDNIDNIWSFFQWSVTSYVNQIQGRLYTKE